MQWAVHRFFISQKSACKKKAVARWTKTWEILQNCNLSVCFATFHLLIELLQLLFCLFKRRCQQRWVWNFCLLAASAFLSEMPRVKKGNGCCSTEVCNQGMNWQYPLWTMFWSKFNTNPSSTCHPKWQDRASAIFSSISSTVGASRPCPLRPVAVVIVSKQVDDRNQKDPKETTWKKMSKRKQYPISTLESPPKIILFW